MSIGGGYLGGSFLGGGFLGGPPGLGISAPLGATTPLSSSTNQAASLQGEIETRIAGGPVLGIFQQRRELIAQILEGFDEDALMEVARILPSLASLASADGAPEARWGRFVTSAVADEMRAQLEPFMETLDRRKDEMDALFAPIFDLANRVTDDQPLDSEPAPEQVMRWSVVIVFWIMTALGSEWAFSDFHLGVIFTVLGVLIMLFLACFK